eukprot:TRINITY_DN9971_c0_g1_i1.p1 TRINITY_DN9971_c0_g1~~TRINITY_DN9971_c0_g1_i1.p1  ORF type:complete len:223 (+),score=27.17 TRINITY_DN9971_c0_g1_i1:39-671(+)
MMLVPVGAALLSCSLGACTIIFAEVLLKGKTNNLDSLNALYYMLPYAVLILIGPAVALEGSGLWHWWWSQRGGEHFWHALQAIGLSGLCAFCLNFALFYTIQTTSAVTFSVAGDLKLACTVVLSWLLFRTPINELNAFGCLLTVLGVVAYGYALYLQHQWERDKRQQRARMREGGAGEGEESSLLFRTSATSVDYESETETVDSYLGAML